MDAAPNSAPVIGPLNCSQYFLSKGLIRTVLTHPAGGGCNRRSRRLYTLYAVCGSYAVAVQRLPEILPGKIIAWARNFVLKTITSRERTSSGTGRTRDAGPAG